MINSFKHPTLREQSVKLTVDEISHIVNKKGDTYDLLQQMEKIVKTTGVGLAATQVGVLKQLFVFKPDPNGDEVKIVINPRIKKLSDMLMPSYEGCLSIPEVYGYVERPSATTLDFTSNTNQRITTTFSGMASCIFLHEYDHLYGVLFIDRAFNRDQRRKFKRKFKFNVAVYTPFEYFGLKNDC